LLFRYGQNEGRLRVFGLHEMAGRAGRLHS
jgi:hypothetical protein